MKNHAHTLPAFMAGFPDPFEAARDILIPEIKYFNIRTHDAWGDALGISPGGTTCPIVLSCDYSKGKFYVLSIPNDPADLYALPPSVLSVIRAALGPAEPIRLDSAPAQVALFNYATKAAGGFVDFGCFRVSDKITGAN
jgi:hypothetical protein